MRRKLNITENDHCLHENHFRPYSCRFRIFNKKLDGCKNNSEQSSITI